MLAERVGTLQAQFWEGSKLKLPKRDVVVVDVSGGDAMAFNTGCKYSFAGNDYHMQRPDVREATAVNDNSFEKGKKGARLSSLQKVYLAEQHVHKKRDMKELAKVAKTSAVTVAGCVRNYLASEKWKDEQKRVHANLNNEEEQLKHAID